MENTEANSSEMLKTKYNKPWKSWGGEVKPRKTWEEETISVKTWVKEEAGYLSLKT